MCSSVRKCFVFFHLFTFRQGVAPQQVTKPMQAFEYSLEDISEADREHFQRLWMSKCFTPLLMGANKIADLIELVEHMSPMVESLRDQKMQETMKVLGRMMQPSTSYGNLDILRQDLTLCRSPFFLLHIPFTHGATGKILQGKLESFRVTMQKQHGYEEVLRFFTTPVVAFTVEDNEIQITHLEDWKTLKATLSQVGVQATAEFAMSNVHYIHLRRAFDQLLAMLLRFAANTYCTQIASLCKTLLDLYASGEGADYLEAHPDGIIRAFPEHLRCLAEICEGEEDLAFTTYVEMVALCNGMSGKIVEVFSLIVKMTEPADCKHDILEDFIAHASAPPSQLDDDKDWTRFVDHTLRVLRQRWSDSLVALYPVQFLPIVVAAPLAVEEFAKVSVPSFANVPDNVDDLSLQLVRIVNVLPPACNVLIKIGDKQCCPRLCWMALVFSRVMNQLDAFSPAPVERASQINSARSQLEDAEAIWLPMTKETPAEAEIPSSFTYISKISEHLKTLAEVQANALLEKCQKGFASDVEAATATMSSAPMTELLELDTWAEDTESKVRAFFSTSHKLASVRTLVGLVSRCKQCKAILSDVNRIFSVRSPESSPDVGSDADLEKIWSAYDVCTVLQLLTRELKTGEELPKLCVLCWKTIKPMGLPTYLRVVLESHIPPMTLVGLKAA
jgi:hypothetical protein